MATYDEILKQIQTSQDKLDPSSISVSQKSPQLEALMGIYGPELANVLKSPIDLKKAGALPQAAGQNQLQQQAIQMQLNQAGLGTAQFDNTTGGTGAFTGMQGTGTGIAGYQPYLNQATTAANAAQAAAADHLLHDQLWKPPMSPRWAGRGLRLRRRWRRCSQR